jgi:putative N-acetylmannosamine-6-phosphate epimerase
MLEPSPAAGAARTSSAVRSVTVEEVMELATSRYIDFPIVGIIDLEVPQLPEKVLEVATE